MEIEDYSFSYFNHTVRFKHYTLLNKGLHELCEYINIGCIFKVSLSSVRFSNTVLVIMVI